MDFEGHRVISVKQGCEAFDLWARHNLLLSPMVTLFYFILLYCWIWQIHMYYKLVSMCLLKHVWIACSDFGKENTFSAYSEVLLLFSLPKDPLTEIRVISVVLGIK